MRTLITLAIQELFRPRRPDPLEWLTPPEPVLDDEQRFDLPWMFNADLWDYLAETYGATAAMKKLTPPRRRRARRWFR